MSDMPDVTRFLDEAFRNIELPALSDLDVSDIAGALNTYTAAHIARLTSERDALIGALLEIQTLNLVNYDGALAWALAMQFRAQRAILNTRATLEALRPSTEGDK